MVTGEMSKALPFVAAPSYLDGSMPGDAGFDPLGFGKDKEGLTFMREAEIKHSRLAMLAVVGWPIAELMDKQVRLRGDELSLEQHNNISTLFI